MSIATIYFPADWDREQCVKWALRHHPEWERGLVVYDFTHARWRTRLHGILP